MRFHVHDAADSPPPQDQGGICRVFAGGKGEKVAFNQNWNGRAAARKVARGTGAHSADRVMSLRRNARSTWAAVEGKVVRLALAILRLRVCCTVRRS